MRFSDVLEPGTREGIVTFANYIKGGYIVVKDLTERNNIKKGVLV